MIILVLYIFGLACRIVLYYVSLFTFNFKIDDGNLKIISKLRRIVFAWDNVAP